MNESSNGNATVYEIINKITGEVSPVSHYGSGDRDNDNDNDFFCKKEDGTEVIFKREGQDGNNAIFVNEEYVIRAVDTKMALDGVTPVEDIVPASESAE